MTMAIKGKRVLFKTLDEKITFGRYNDKTIEDVLKTDKWYIVWMHNNTNHKLGKRLLKIIIELYPDLEKELKN